LIRKTSKIFYYDIDNLLAFDEVYVRYVLDWMKNMDKSTARKDAK